MSRAQEYLQHPPQDTMLTSLSELNISDLFVPSSPDEMITEKDYDIYLSTDFSPEAEALCNQEIFSTFMLAGSDECNIESSTDKLLLPKHSALKQSLNIFQCFQCCYVTNDDYQLREHIKSHTSENFPYECNYCRCKFSTMFKFTSHQSNANCHKFLEMLTCNICHRTFTTKPILKCHLLKQHCSSNSLKCKNCGKLFNDKYSLNIHLVQEDKKYLKCDICPYKTLIRNNFKRHQRFHLKQKKNNI